MKNGLIVLVVIILICNNSVSITLRNSIKMEKNLFKTCFSTTSCEECQEDNFFKKCDKVCYCCNYENKCFSQNNN
jgi:hypothetical protein